MAVAGVRISAPADFGVDRTSATLRGPDPAPVPGLMSARPSRAARANLVVERRRIPAGVPFQAVVDEVSRDLAAAVPKLELLAAEAITFDDGGSGTLLHHRFPYSDGILLEQLQALRLDANWLTTVVLTAGSPLRPDDRDRYLSTLRSTRPET